MTKDILIWIGMVVYVIGAIRAYDWMRKQLVDDVAIRMLGKPGKTGCAIAALLGWYMIEIALLLWWNDESTHNVIKRYETCPDCAGRPLLLRYRPLWKIRDKPYNCETCNGQGLIRRRDYGKAEAQKEEEVRQDDNNQG